MGHPTGQMGPAAQLNSRGQHLHTQNPQQYTDYGQPSQANSRRISDTSDNSHVTFTTQTNESQQSTPWVQTTVGWRKNPFL